MWYVMGQSLTVAATELKAWSNAETIHKDVARQLVVSCETYPTRSSLCLSAVCFSFSLFCLFSRHSLLLLPFSSSLLALTSPLLGR